MENSQQIVEAMYSQDWFSQWLGIERVKVEKGHVVLKMKIRREMLNGFGIAHGGITYSFADSAFAFASNSEGLKAVSIETSISHLVSLKEDDTLIAEARRKNVGNKTGLYHVDVKKENGELVASFKGTVYRTSKAW